ncbi:uncharacterized protein LOC118188528 [Stegodyphus dumicola]|uniref:uncharacterized protein LOC118188528 n=1 Tax=Stegodyphus dumicola TaxID=202533 RepID=UPI0015AB3472|nr:uncharacterized protein LOC118188528 [Stegodyphus dumicola]
MDLEYTLFVICYMALFTCSREIPLELNNGTATPANESKAEIQVTSLVNNTEEVTDKETSSGSRLNYARILPERTTLGYEEWWFLTTRRPIISFKDFPGRPGVATWKELSPSAGADDRKMRKTSNPTAAGVSSSCRMLKGFDDITLILKVLWIAYWFPFYYW